MPDKIPIESHPNENCWQAGPAWHYGGLGFAGEERADAARSNPTEPVRVKPGTLATRESTPLVKCVVLDYSKTRWYEQHVALSERIDRY